MEENDTVSPIGYAVSLDKVVSTVLGINKGEEMKTLRVHNDQMKFVNTKPQGKNEKHLDRSFENVSL